ncbi:hypothetical protein [Alkalimonas amylolytica]|uniref:asparagine synthase (glutamine-hydrolyzing) n=1 Tax=Alkalimonas amylolytica TaxID=152573 RepID=A0A1H4CCJ6_ALKAM|nr:hypothetical protein [Alkalimonas amylolytica]SEA58175.1 hypothetical protein SAMN04488051_10498 [Alkalimonas amylolytica]
METLSALQLGTKQDFLLRLRCQQQRLSFEGEPQGFVGYVLDDQVCDDGVFVRWNYADGHFELSTDRLGLYPVYYMQSEHELLISNSVSMIQREQRLEVNTEAVGIFLRLGFYLGSDTAFRTLHRPTGKLTVSAGDSGIQVKVTRPEPTQVGYQHTTEKYQQLMQQSLAYLREIKQPLYMPLTGGKDSRHIFLSLIRLNIQPDLCYTVSVLAPHYNDDVVIARRLAELFAVPHQTLAPDYCLIQSEYTKNRQTNLETRDHSWAAPAADFFNQAPPGVLLDGFGGDVLSQSSVISAEMHQRYQQADWAGLIKAFLKDNRYFNGWLRKSHHPFIVDEGVLQQRLIAELRSFHQANNPMAQFFFWNRSRRSIAISSIRYLSGQSTAFMPFMQKEMLEFLFTLPVELYFSKAFHSNTISQLGGEASTLPFGGRDVLGGRLTQQQWRLMLSSFLSDLQANPVVSPGKKVKVALQALSSWTDKPQLVRLLFSYRRVAYLRDVVSDQPEPELLEHLA